MSKLSKLEGKGGKRLKDMSEEEVKKSFPIKPMPSLKGLFSLKPYEDLTKMIDSIEEGEARKRAQPFIQTTLLRRILRESREASVLSKVAIVIAVFTLLVVIILKFI